LRRAFAPAAALLMLAGCHLGASKPPPAPTLHYVLGDPYESDGVWRYPRARYDLDETGLAVVTTRVSGFTEDGEVADPTALSAAHPTLPLPALARVTNLETGLQLLVRVNDRGPPQRGRIIALTPRAIQLLGGGDAPMRVRVQVLEAESRQMAADLDVVEAPRLPVAAAPAGDVAAEALPPPPGVRVEATRAAPSGPRPKVVATSAIAAPVPMRLPEQLWQVPPRPGTLYVELATFSGLRAAEVMRQRLAYLGAQTSTSYEAPRDRAYRVRIGPLADVAAADAALTRALAAGVADPRILVE
jgi:rare lipoprotein A